MFGEVPMARTLYRKILDKHVVRAIDANTVLLYVHLHFANEYTSPQAFAGLVERGVKAPVPDAHLCVVDHIIPSADVTPRVIADAASLRQAETLEANCRRNGIDAFYGVNDPHQGIEHVVVAEQGLVRLGMVVICGDSHTMTHGALGARRLVHLPGKHAADDGARAEELLAKLLGRGLAVGFESLVAGESMNEAAYDLDVLFSDGADFQTHEGKQFLR